MTRPTIFVSKSHLCTCERELYTGTWTQCEQHLLTRLSLLTFAFKAKFVQPRVTCPSSQQAALMQWSLTNLSAWTDNNPPWEDRAKRKKGHSGNPACRFVPLISPLFRGFRPAPPSIPNTQAPNPQKIQLDPFINKPSRSGIGTGPCARPHVQTDARTNMRSAPVLSPTLWGCRQD